MEVALTWGLVEVRSVAGEVGEDKKGDVGNKRRSESLDLTCGPPARSPLLHHLLLNAHTSPNTHLRRGITRPTPHFCASFMSERGNKSSNRHATNIQRHRVDLEDDFEVIQARTSSLTGRGRITEGPKSPLKGRTTWTVGESWAPDDDSEFDLDSDSEGYDEEVEIGLERALPPESREEEPSKKKAKTQASVSLPSLLLPSSRSDTFCLGLSESLLEGEVSRFLPRRALARGRSRGLYPRCSMPGLYCQRVSEPFSP